MELDAEVAAELERLAALVAGVDVPDRDDPLALRVSCDEELAHFYGLLPEAPDVTGVDFVVEAEDGFEVPLRLYRRAGGVGLTAGVVYVHGGGLIAGSVDAYDRLVRHYVQVTGVTFVAVGYRLAPEVTGVTPAGDVFAGVRWMCAHAGEHGVDAARVAVMADSGGAAPAVGAVILARAAGVRVVRQILIYPMLDDRNLAPDPHLESVALWTYDNNYTGWFALLGESLGGPDVSAVASPGRLTDFVGLPPGYVEIGEADIFRDEAIGYAHNLMRAGVSCELHVYAGAPHGYDWLFTGTALSERAVGVRMQVLKAL